MSFLWRRATPTPEKGAGEAPAPRRFGASGSAPPQPGVPLELVKYDAATGKFELGVQAMEVLKGTRGPVGVVAVCGRARQVGG